MASSPVVRARILKRLVWGSFEADTLEELRQVMCMEDVSMTQFCEAIGSLHFNHKQISVIRRGPESLHDRKRPYKVVPLSLAS